MNNPTDNKQEKINKKKGPIRFEAVIPAAILSGITFLYFSYYFDSHLKKLFEYVGTQANGAEVNVKSLRTSFVRGSFHLDGLEVTQPERPSHNSIEIGNIHFKFLWDALLRMKFVVEDASINNIQISKPRSKPGFVLPPKPAAPSKLEEIQDQVISQIKNKYSSNMLGDVVSILDGGDYEDQIQKIRETLKSEQRIKEMVSEINEKKNFWDGKVKQLSDPSKIKEIETTIQSVKNEKNFLKQAEGVKKLTDLLKDAKTQYDDIEKNTKIFKTEVKTLLNYPQEIQTLIDEDISSLKNRFSVPQMDFKDLATTLFASQFAGYMVKARKYQAMAEQYLPEKKKEEEIIPRKRSEGKNYEFPITSGHPLFWLKRAAISSKGTADSYSGQVSGELTNVTTSPKLVNKPVVLDLKGDFPASKIYGVSTLVTADFTQDVPSQSVMMQVKSFPVPEKIFVQNDKIKFGFLKADGSSTFSAQLQDNRFQMNWISTLNKPQFTVETSNKLAREMLSNIVNNIPAINIDGSVSGTFRDFDMNINSNLGTELSEGFRLEIGAKITEAQNKIKALVDEKINGPKAELMASLGENNNNLSKLNNLMELYKKNEDKIKEELQKLKKNGGVKDLKETGKKLLKGIKL